MAGADAVAVEGVNRNADPPDGGDRQLQPESFQWGAQGLFRENIKAAYHVVCRWHGKSGNTFCSKQLSFDAQPRDLALRRLKVWCLSAPRYHNKAEHQGGRGLHPLSAADDDKTHAELDEAERALPLPRGCG